MGLVDGLGHGLFAINILAGGGRIDGDLGVPVIRRGDANDVYFLQIQNAVIILGDMFLVVKIEAAALGRWVQTLQIFILVLLSFLVGPFLLFLVAVPDVADAHGGNALLVLLKLGDDADVFLAAAAGADEGDADPLVGPKHPFRAGGRQRQRGRSHGGRFQKVTPIPFLLRH